MPAWAKLTTKLLWHTFSWRCGPRRGVLPVSWNTSNNSPGASLKNPTLSGWNGCVRSAAPPFCAEDGLLACPHGRPSGPGDPWIHARKGKNGKRGETFCRPEFWWTDSEDIFLAPFFWVLQKKMINKILSLDFETPVGNWALKITEIHSEAPLTDGLAKQKSDGQWF